MARRVTIVDIARAAGVSKSTVSLVLTGAAGVRPATEQAVRAAMVDLGYIYNRGAANLRKPKTRIVGMVINDLSNPFFAELVIGIERALRASGIVPFLANTAECLARQAEMVRSMCEHGASGILLCPTIDSTAAEIETLAEFGVPLVLAIRRVPGVRLPIVFSDNGGGAALATERLLGLGHVRIGFVGGLSSSRVRADRLAGFRAAHAKAGVAPDPSLVVECAPTKDGGFTALTALLARPDRPTAVLCFNDVVALGAMLAVNRAGLVPGRDVAVIGFDDIAEARYASPPLTTVSVRVGELGEMAGAMLLRRIEGADGPESFRGEARLVVRQSCGAPLALREVA